MFSALIGTFGCIVISMTPFDQHQEELTHPPSRKKPSYPISNAFRQYLRQHGREVQLPVQYQDLQRFTYSVPLMDRAGNYTLWEQISYDMKEWEWIKDGLVHMYAILKTEGDLRFSKHLKVARIDYCTFGNSNPFRIRIVNQYNDNYDHFYIKVADASRVYGLELEHILSPDHINFFTFGETLVEEHIPGIPGDVFIQDYLPQANTNLIRFAKEFVKFNERCFVRLLGDMRSYNFVVNIIPDIEDVQYRIRAIDFDQQSYEGRKKLYLPQFFKENLPLVQVCMDHLNEDSIEQYQTEEKSMMAYRVSASRYRLASLIQLMQEDTLSTTEKTEQLSKELYEHYQDEAFLQCSQMGAIVKMQLKKTLYAKLQQITKDHQSGFFPS